MFFLILFQSAILRITLTNKSFWTDSFFKSYKPESLIENINWIKNNYMNEQKILIVKSKWPEGPYIPYLEWTMYMLDIDMVSSFLYVGTLYDLLISNPSKNIGRPNPLPNNSNPSIKNINDYKIFLIDSLDKKSCFYNPNTLEYLILDEPRPNLYMVKELNSSQVDNWIMLYKSAQEG